MRASNLFRLGLLLTSMAAAVASCSKDEPFVLQTTGGGGAGGNGGEGGAFVDNGKLLFEALEPDLTAACASCHEPNGLGDAPFLALPDRYASVLSWPGIVTADPQQSLFLTYSVAGKGHTGTNIDGDPSLMAKVEEWLTAESTAIVAPVEEGTPTLPAFTPILGLNVVYLAPLDKDLEGVAIAFTASKLTETSLKLDGLEVYTTATTGLHVVHPVFAVYPKGEDPTADPADSFSGLDARFDEGTVGPLGVGTLILTNWKAEAKLGLGFELAEPYVSSAGMGGNGGGGGTVEGGCGDVASFDANAKPALTNSCVNCHGGNNGQATAALDLSDLDNNSGATCAQVKNRVNFDNPQASQLFITTDPGGNASHPFKFGGNAGAFQGFRDNVTLWIESEP